MPAPIRTLAAHAVHGLTRTRDRARVRCEPRTRRRAPDPSTIRPAIAAWLAVAACTGAEPPPVDPSPASVPVDEPPDEPPYRRRWDLRPPRLADPAEDAAVTLTRDGLEILLASDGTARVTAGSDAPRLGRVPPILVDMLVRHARDTNYVAAAGRHGDDGPAVVTSLVVAGARTEVHDHAAAAPPAARGFAWMIDAASLLVDWDPPPPDDRTDAVRRGLCDATAAEMRRGTSHTSPLRLSPLGSWPPWTSESRSLCADTSWPVAPAARPARFPDLREVTLQRGHCYDGCPTYSARLRADGRVLALGDALALRPGVSLGRVPPVLVEMLAAYAVDTGYPAAARVHGEQRSHAARKTTSLALAGRRTWVTSRGDEPHIPAAIAGFEHMIDAALTLTTWDPAPPTAVRTTDELRRLCEPTVADAQARCREALAGAPAGFACDRASTAAAELQPTDGPHNPAVGARCEYLAGVLPDPPIAAPSPIVKLKKPDAACRRLLGLVRARCVDALATGAPHRACGRLTMLMTDVDEPHAGAHPLCDRHADEVREELGDPKRR
jgi:hypothetical protein